MRCAASVVFGLSYSVRASATCAGTLSKSKAPVAVIDALVRTAENVARAGPAASDEAIALSRGGGTSSFNPSRVMEGIV
jgi:hypothetical protein